MISDRLSERDYTTSIEAARRAIADSPQYPVTYRWLAAAFGQLGRLIKAREALRQAETVSPRDFAF
jgi:adenylate cyclase